MSRPATGVLVPVADISDAFVEIKIRTLGCITAYRMREATAMLTARRASIAVDVSLILSAEGQDDDVVKIGANVFVLGTVERRPDGKIVIAAARVFDSEGASLNLWEESARRLSQYLHSNQR